LDKLKINLYSRIAHKNTNIITTTLSLGGNRQVYQLLTWLYKDSTIYLPRKYEKYLELKQFINEKY